MSLFGGCIILTRSKAQLNNGLTAVQVKGRNTWYRINHCTKVLSERRRQPPGHEDAEDADTSGGCPKGTGAEEIEEPGRRQAGAEEEVEQLPTADRHYLLKIQRVQGWGGVTCLLLLIIYLLWQIPLTEVLSNGTEKQRQENGKETFLSTSLSSHGLSNRQ